MCTAKLLSSVQLMSLLIGLALPVGVATDRRPLTLDKTTGVKVHTGARLTLPCGDGTPKGVVQYWHTPFGQVQNDSLRGLKEIPVAMQSDGSLKINTVTQHHSGLYYCLLQDTEGITLYPYRLHTLRDQHDHKRGERGQSQSVVQPHLDQRESGPRPAQRGPGPHGRVVRPQRSAEDLRDEEEGRAAALVSDSQFAGAVAASVAVTFLVGFSSGALSRTLLLRCMRATGDKIRTLRRRHSQTTTVDHPTEVTMATLPSMYDNGAFQTDREPPASATGVTISTVTPFAPAKPQRSFRRGREEEEPEAAAYLEGCDKSGRERGGEDEGRRDIGGEESGEANEWRDGEKEGGTEGNGSEREVSEPLEVGTQPDEEKREGERKGEEEKKDGVGDEEACSPPRPARRSRVIRLYQYDEEGHRYGHLPNSAPSETGPAPRPKQRSLSLTRLNAIMAAASANPLDPPSNDTSREERDLGEGGGDPSNPDQERPVFKMEI